LRTDGDTCGCVIRKADQTLSDLPVEYRFSLVSLSLVKSFTCAQDHVKGGHEKEFEDNFSSVVSLLKNADFGFLSGKLYRDVGDSSEYMLYTEWEGIEAFRKFTISNEYAQTIEFGKTIIDGQPRHKIFH